MAAPGYQIIVNGRNNRAPNSFATIVNGRANSASTTTQTYCLVGNGYLNITNASFSTILNGKQNNNSGTFSTIIGGSANTITTVNAVSSSAILGGNNNTIFSDESAILGGNNNTIFSTTGGASIIAGSNINAVSANTAYGARINIRDFMQLSATTTQPIIEIGVVWFSGGSKNRLMYYSGNNASDVVTI